MTKFKINDFKNLINSQSQKKLTSLVLQLSELLAPKIDLAKKERYSSFKLSTTLKTQDQNREFFTLDNFSFSKVFTQDINEYQLPNVFEKIILDPKSAIENDTVFLSNQDDHIIIKDKYPSAPTHFLTIPKTKYTTILEMPISEVAKLYAYTIQAIFFKLQLSQAKIITNVAPPNQKVPHVHVHLMSDQISEDAR
jgi:diadenosine tetraphosphate (Ap4A) HIT family hydrolase